MIKKYSAGLPLAAAVEALSAVLPLTLLGAAFLLSSCARKPTLAPGATTTAAAPEGGTALVKSYSPSPRALGDGRQPDPKPLSALAASLRAYGLGAPSVPRIPEDFSLGPLQSFGPAEGDEAAVFEAARKFMDGIAAGKLREELLLPEARGALSLLLAPPSSAGASAAAPASYRLGAISLRGEDASLKVRMPWTGYAAGSESAPAAAKPAREEGLLSLRKVEGAWYVEALALGPPLTDALAFSPDARGATK